MALKACLRLGLDGVGNRRGSPQGVEVEYFRQVEAWGLDLICMILEATSLIYPASLEQLTHSQGEATGLDSSGSQSVAALSSKSKSCSFYAKFKEIPFDSARSSSAWRLERKCSQNKNASMWQMRICDKHCCLGCTLPGSGKVVRRVQEEGFKASQFRYN